jgi:hypothetical protein
MSEDLTLDELLSKTWKQTGKWAAPDDWGDSGWDHYTGAPTLGMMSGAIQVWSMLQDCQFTSVAEAAAAFKIPPERVIEAVNDHPWMFLSGPGDDYAKLIICHDED